MTDIFLLRLLCLERVRGPGQAKERRVEQLSFFPLSFFPLLFELGKLVAVRGDEVAFVLGLDLFEECLTVSAAAVPNGDRQVDFLVLELGQLRPT